MATGCVGASNTSLIVWSAETGEPLASVDTPHAHGTVALAVSADNRILASLSAPFPVILQPGENLPGGMGQTPPAAVMVAQEVSVWAMPEDPTDNNGRTAIPPGMERCSLQLLGCSVIPVTDLQHSLAFNTVGQVPHPTAFNGASAGSAMLLLHDLVTTGMSTCVFWSLAATSLEPAVEALVSSNGGGSVVMVDSRALGLASGARYRDIPSTPLAWQWQLMHHAGHVPGCAPMVPHSPGAMAAANAVSVANRRRLLGLPPTAESAAGGVNGSSAMIPGASSAANPPLKSALKRGMAALNNGSQAAGGDEMVVFGAEGSVSLQSSSASLVMTTSLADEGQSGSASSMVTAPQQQQQLGMTVRSGGAGTTAATGTGTAAGAAANAVTILPVYAAIARSGIPALGVLPGGIWQGFTWSHGSTVAATRAISHGSDAVVAQSYLARRKATSTVFLPHRTSTGGSARVSAVTATTDGVMMQWASQLDLDSGRHEAKRLQELAASAMSSAKASAAATLRGETAGSANDAFQDPFRKTSTATATSGTREKKWGRAVSRARSRGRGAAVFSKMNEDGTTGEDEDEKPFFFAGRGSLQARYPILVYSEGNLGGPIDPPPRPEDDPIELQAMLATCNAMTAAAVEALPLRLSVVQRLASQLCLKQYVRQVKLTKGLSPAAMAAMAASGGGGEDGGAGGDDEGGQEGDEGEDQGDDGGSAAGDGGTVGAAGGPYAHLQQPPYQPPPLGALNSVILSPSGQHLLVGGEDGCLRAYDTQLRLVAWWDEMEAGPITSLSFFPSRSAFAGTPGFGSMRGGQMPSPPGSPGGQSGAFSLHAGADSDEEDEAAAAAQGDAVLNINKLPHVLVSTRRCLLLHLDPKSFEEGGEARRGTVLLEGPDSAVTGVVSYPFPYNNLLAVAVASGCVQLWDVSSGPSAAAGGGALFNAGTFAGAPGQLTGALARSQPHPQLLAVRELIRPHGFAAGSAAAAAAALGAPQLFHPTCMAIDRYCRFLCCGTFEGFTVMLDPLTLSDTQPALQPGAFQSAIGGPGGAGTGSGAQGASQTHSGTSHGGGGGRGGTTAGGAGAMSSLGGGLHGPRNSAPITHISIADDGIHLATADVERHVALWRYVRKRTKQISRNTKSKLGLGSKAGSFLLSNNRKRHGSAADSNDANHRPLAWELVDGDLAGLEDAIEDSWTYMGRAKAHGSVITGLGFNPLPAGAISPFVSSNAAAGLSSRGGTAAPGGGGGAMMTPKGGHEGGDQPFWDPDNYQNGGGAVGVEGILGQHRAAGLSLLASIGNDRRVILYDVGASSVVTGLVVAFHGGARYHISQFATPTACMWYPPGAPALDSEPTSASSSDCLLIPSTDLKLRAWRLNPHPAAISVASTPGLGGPAMAAALFPGTNPVTLAGPSLLSQQAPACIRTALAPTLRGNITSIAAIEVAESVAAAAATATHGSRPVSNASSSSSHASGSSFFSHNLMAFATDDRCIGVCSLPFGGSPQESLSLVAHPGPVLSLAASAGGERLFSAGIDSAYLHAQQMRHALYSNVLGLKGGPGPSSGDEGMGSGRSAIHAALGPHGHGGFGGGSIAFGGKRNAAFGGAKVFLPDTTPGSGGGSVCIWSLEQPALHSYFKAATDALVKPAKGRRGEDGEEDEGLSQQSSLADNGSITSSKRAEKDAKKTAAALAAREEAAALAPFLALLEAGDSGLYTELRDVFAYAQIRSQGEDSTQKRAVSATLPLSEVPSVMRALGFYPTSSEMAALHCEAVGKAFSSIYKKALANAGYAGSSSSPSTNASIPHAVVAQATHTATLAALKAEVDLPTLIKLFVNHRPALAPGRDELMQALRVISRYIRMTSNGNNNHNEGPQGLEALQSSLLSNEFGEDGIGGIKWGALSRLLSVRGERMLQPEVFTCLTALLGPPDGPDPSQDRDPDDLPAAQPTHFENEDELTAPAIVGRVLGFAEA